MSDQHELEERVKTAQAECERLREENVRLRAMLSIHDQFSNTQPRRHQALRLRIRHRSLWLRCGVESCLFRAEARQPYSRS